MRAAIITLTCMLLFLCACSEKETGTQITPAKVPVQKQKAPAGITSDLDKGPAIFNHWCRPCHDAGPGHPGTMALTQRLGEEQSVLLERDNLTVDYVKYVVRNGLQMMPPLKPTEISDADLEFLASFVAPGKRN